MSLIAAAARSARLPAWVQVACLVVATALSTGCVRVQPVVLRNGSLDLNPRLRGDLGASAQMPDGRFFSDGSCSGAAGPLDECHFIVTLRNSLLTPAQLQHLRRAQYFWMESEGFPQLSYEVIARDFKHVPEAIKRKIACENAARLYQIDLN